MTRTGKLASDGRLQTSKALFGAAVVYLVPAIMYWSIRGFALDLFSVVILGGCTIFVAMGILARWTPLAPAIISGALYALNLAWLWRNVPAWNPIAWILHGAIASLLLIALVAAIKYARKPSLVANESN